MRCQWQALINLLPLWMRKDVDKHGRNTMQELRLRVDQPPEIVTSNGSVILDGITTGEDIRTCINMATKYSPWSAGTITHGFFTALGGHRIGISGAMVMKEDAVVGVHHVTSVCIRVARDFPGIAQKIASLNGSLLIIGRPGCGKTTLLRDLIRQKSALGQGAVSVVDEREEIFPRIGDRFAFFPGQRTDVISCCAKKEGIIIALRNMSPNIIAVDEITAQSDCDAVLHAGWCGVELLATAHAANAEEFYKRPVYKPLVDSKLFTYLIVLNADKTWHIERMK